ncbi:HAD-IA family hydrolase [Candidatus Woesearchaeota archaeon]|nr:HAD-IA family hydrolase [Candidatus Woesearchaeota archaeon]
MKQQQKSSIEVIFFDIGGVVCQDIEKFMMRDIAKKYKLSYREVMKARGKWWKLYATKRISEKEYWQSFLKDVGIQESYTHFLSLPYQKYIQKMPGMESVLKRLVKTYPLFVLSDHAPEWWAYAQKTFHLQKYFQGSILSFNYGALKEEKKMFREAIKMAKVKPKEILFIDNSEKNLQVAKSLGMDILLFTNPKELLEELKKRKILF